MRFGFFGDDVLVSGTKAAAQIKSSQKGLAKRQSKNDFNVWAKMYATPFARDLLNKSHLEVVRQERARQLTKKPDAGVRAVGEVAKISDKLVETKQKQAKVREMAKEKMAKGDVAGAKQLAMEDKAFAMKAKVIEGQLAKRVDEGLKLAKAKKIKENKRGEVLQKRQAQMAAAPHLADVWRKHDSMYEQHRARVIQKHDQAEMKAETLKAELKQMPKSLEKDAKMERLRKEEADRRVKQELELAKLDEKEAARLDARAKTEGMKRIK